MTHGSFCKVGNTMQTENVTFWSWNSRSRSKSILRQFFYINLHQTKSAGSHCDGSDTYFPCILYIQLKAI